MHDRKEIPTRTKTPKKTNKVEGETLSSKTILFIACNLYHAISILRVVSNAQKDNPPTSEASREVANLTERKNPHTPV